MQDQSMTHCQLWTINEGLQVGINIPVTYIYKGRIVVVSSDQK